MIILGIDPGTATTGFGVIRTNGKIQMELVDFGLIETPKEATPANRLIQIYSELTDKVIKRHKPNVFVIEKVFFATNAKTAIRVGQAQGVMLMAAATNNIEVVEFSPMTIKKVLTGNGRSKKPDVQKSVRKFLGARVRKQKGKKTHFDDAADALAVAICHILTESKKEASPSEVLVKGGDHISKSEK